MCHKDAKFSVKALAFLVLLAIIELVLLANHYISQSLY